MFAAGNDGLWKFGVPYYRDDCTISSPGIGKNILTIGATSTGPDRLPTTDSDGFPYEYPYSRDFADIDTVAWFSSYGFTDDGRIKPEVVAPGDKVRLL